MAEKETEIQTEVHPLDKWLKYLPSGMADNLRNQYDTKTDEERQGVFKKLAIGTGLFLIVASVLIFGDSSTEDYAEKRKQAQEKPVTKELISSEKIDSLADEALAKQITDMQKLMERMEKNQEQLTQKHQKELEELKEREDKLRTELSEVKSDKTGEKAQESIEELAKQMKEEIVRFQQQQKQETEEIKSKMREKLGNIYYQTNSELDGAAVSKNEGEEALAIYEYGAEKKPDVTKPVKDDGTQTTNKDEAEQEDANTTYLPSGTLMGGVLLSGLDAKTNIIGTEDNPQPVIVRLKGNAILPNGFQTDVHDCHALMSGWGDINSERVHLRSTKISCVAENGNVIDVPFDAIAMSSIDGKEGIRGRLVSREGRLITKATVAGFIQGVAGAFKPAFQLGGTMQTDATGMMQMPSGEQVAQIGAYGGVSNAMSKLADYYVAMIGKMSPILEIRPLQEVNLVLVEGVSLQWAK
jgi:conjugal transfer pilus assembly protein TraB